MITCIIVDDEPSAVDVVKHFVSKSSNLQLLETFNNPLEALAYAHAHKPQLIFLDVQMPELNGIEFVEAITGTSHVILTTAYSEFALDGFDHGVIDYLLKPIAFPRFLKAVQRAQNILSPNIAQANVQDKSVNIDDDYIFVKTELKGKMLKINLSEIDYIESLKNYVAIVRGSDKTLALLSMKNLEWRLPPSHFMRVHKSFIIATHKITMVEGNQVVLKNQLAKIPIGDMYKEPFMEAMKEKLM